MSLASLIQSIGNKASTRPRDLIVLCHATGFHKGVWRPVIQHLADIAESSERLADVVSFDFSGHGESAHRPADARNWAEFCPRDVNEAMSANSGEGIEYGTVMGVGHSMGGAAVLLAEIESPSLFDTLVCFEPIVFPTVMNPDDHPDFFENHPLAKMTMVRRSHFKSFEDAVKYWGGKELFSTWDPRAFKAYVAGALRPVLPGGEYVTGTVDADAATKAAAMGPEGSESKEGTFVDSGVVLKCTTTFEADVYRGYHPAWDTMPGIKCPVYMGVGEKSNTFDALGDTVEIFRGVSERLPNHEFDVVPECGHFLVMEKPSACAWIIARRLGWVSAAL